MRWVERQGLSWLEAELPGARAAFTTRLGGVSPQPYRSLNLGFMPRDEAAHVAENRRRAITGLGFEPEQVLSARQVHGAALQLHDSAQLPAPFAASSMPQPGLPSPPEADGQVTARPDLVPLVLVADCLPVALTGTATGERRAAMIHCGWRPVAGEILAAAVSLTGAERDGAAAIGPGIGPCCFEVGPEVLAHFEHLGPGISHGRMLDLPEVAERLLRRAGVEQIERSGHCTMCEPELFFSHRRDGAGAGRQAGLAWLDPGA